MKRSFLIFVLFACITAVGVTAYHPAFAQTQPQTLRVATHPILPFMIKQDAQWDGFSEDLWDALAERMGVNYEWVEYKNDDELVAAVQSGQADAAIAAIAMTPQREREIDFSTSYFDSGLQILVMQGDENPGIQLIRAIFSPALLQFFGVVAIIALILAHVIWFTERKENPAFQNGYLRGIGEGLWGVMLIIATGEFGDRDVPNIVRRLLVATMWVVGVVMIAQFTATVTSSLTVKQLQSSIQGPGDLPGKTIGTVPDSLGAAYLRDLGIPYVEFNTGDEGYAMLTNGTIQAVVFDAPTLQYWAATRGNGVVQVVGPVFRPVKYGIVVSTGNPLRKQINEALLNVYEDGTYEAIYNKWFNQGN